MDPSFISGFLNPLLHLLGFNTEFDNTGQAVLYTGIYDEDHIDPDEQPDDMEQILESQEEKEVPTLRVEYEYSAGFLPPDSSNGTPTGNARMRSQSTDPWIYFRVKV